MKKKMIGLVGVFLAIVMSTSSNAAITFSLGSPPPDFTGAGTYTIDVTATATGQDEQIGGYNLQIDFAGIGITGTPTLIGVAPLDTFPTVFPLATPTEFGFSAFAQPLPANAFAIANGDTATIAQIQLIAQNPGTAIFDPLGTLAFDENNSPISLNAPSFSPQVALAVAIPEPSFGVFMAVGVIFVGVYRRRRKRLA